MPNRTSPEYSVQPIDFNESSFKHQSHEFHQNLKFRHALFHEKDIF